MNLGGQSEHDVADGLLVIILPILDFLLVGRYVLFRWCVIPSDQDSSAVNGYVGRTWSGEDTPLALQHEEAFHGSGPHLVVGTREDGNKDGEAGRHVSC